MSSNFWKVLTFLSVKTRQDFLYIEIIGIFEKTLCIIWVRTLSLFWVKYPGFQSSKFGQLRYFNSFRETRGIQLVLPGCTSWLHFLKVLRCKLDSNLWLTFCSIQSLLMYCITVWHSCCTTADREMLQGILGQHSKSSAAVFNPSIYTFRRLNKAKKIIRAAPTLALPCLICCPLAGTLGALGQEQTGSKTFSCPWLWPL